MVISGRIRVDRRTKNMIKRILPHEIAVIDHEDLDEVAAKALVKARIKAVINARVSITGKYPNPGPFILLKNNILLLDNAGQAVLDLKDGQVVEIRDNCVYVQKKPFAQGTLQTLESVNKQLESGRANLQESLEKFVDNTLYYAQQERARILGDLNIPQLKTSLLGKQALIVVRGRNYIEDLATVKSYIRDLKPVLIGVDGGADALIENGYKPDLIFGDMDSVSDQVLACGAEIVVHAYTDGQAPGMERVEKLGLQAKVFAVGGTSEDAAMLLAYHGGIELIVAVGTHSNIIDFLEKGRNGMASTLLTRIKVGSILVDAKGVSKLYNGPLRITAVFQVIFAALFPFFMILSVSTIFSQLGRLLLLKFKMSWGF